LQKLTQISNYDIWYLDNFYDEPDQVRELALNTKYHFYSNTNYPGIRSKGVTINKKFASINEKNINIDLKNCQLHFLELFNKKIPIFDNKNFNLEIGFHKIPIFDSDLKSPFNTGYIHVDSLDYIFENNKNAYAGLVYLNKKTTSSAGTSFFKIKYTKDNQIKITDNDNFKIFNSLFDEYDYSELFQEYTNLYNPFVKHKYWNFLLQNKKLSDSKFEKVFEVENVYNRIVIYDSTYFHTSSHFYVNDFEDRLTQPFFIKML